MKKERVFLVLSFFLGGVILIAFQNCSVMMDSEHGTYVPSSTFSGPDVEAIVRANISAASSVLESSCAECHNAEATDTTLTNITDMEALTSSNWVVIGEPENSPLHMRPLNDLAANVSPHNNLSGLSLDDVDILRYWILGGAILEDDLSGQLTGDFEFATGEALNMEPTFANVNRLVIRNNCFSCHRPGGARAQTPLTNYAEVSGQANAILNRMSRNFGDPGVMPQSGPMPPIFVNMVRLWVEAGAPDN